MNCRTKCAMLAGLAATRPLFLLILFAHDVRMAGIESNISSISLSSQRGLHLTTSVS